MPASYIRSSLNISWDHDIYNVDDSLDDKVDFHHLSDSSGIYTTTDDMEIASNDADLPSFEADDHQGDVVLDPAAADVVADDDADAAADAAAETAPMPSSTPTRGDRGRKPAICCLKRFFVIAWLVAVAGAVASVVAFSIVSSRNNDSDDDASVSTATTTTDDDRDHTAPSLQPKPSIEQQQRMYHDQLLQLLNVPPISSLNGSENVMTPQQQAVAWLAYSDNDFHYHPGDWDRLLQRYALLVFHFATGRWIQVGSWSTNFGSRHHECLWPGVYCDSPDNDHDHPQQTVYRLEVDERFGVIIGSLPTELALLSNLGRLFIQNSQLTGRVPDEIFSLSKLYAIRLSNARLSSNLSSFIGNLSDLAYLDLTSGGFTGRLPTELGVLTQMRYLLLSENNFTGPIPTFKLIANAAKASFSDTSLIGGMPSEICQLLGSRLVDLVASCSRSMPCDCCTQCLRGKNPPS